MLGRGPSRFPDALVGEAPPAQVDYDRSSCSGSWGTSVGVRPTDVTASSTSVANELVDRSQELVRTVQRHDREKLDELLAREFTLLGAVGELNREELLEAAAGPYEIEDFAYEEIDPAVYGNTAVVVSRYWQKARLGDRDLTRALHVTDVWVRRDGRWQIVRRHASAI